MSFFSSIFSTDPYQKAKELLKEHFSIEGKIDEIKCVGLLDGTKDPWEIAAMCVGGGEFEGLSEYQKLTKGLNWLKKLKMMIDKRMAGDFYIDYLKETIAFQLELDPDIGIDEMINDINRRMSVTSPNI